MLKQLTEEFFEYSIVLSKENNIVRESVILNHLLEESIAAFYTILKERHIVPDIQMPEDKISRMVDRSALSRVFSNLINNAIKYSDGDLHIVLYKTGEIIFTNTVTRLNEVQVGKLFDRFFTVEAARNSTGLGLTISKTLIEQMHGTISAKYKENKLSIHIFFPDSEI